MVRKKAVPSATKADLDEAVGSLLGRMATKDDLKLMATKEDLKLMATKEDLKLMATKADLKEEISSARRDLGLAILKTHKRIDDLDDSLRARLSAFSSEVLGRLDIFTDRMETIWRESKTLPQVIDEQGRQLGNHEARIKSLERRTI